MEEDEEASKGRKQERKEGKGTDTEDDHMLFTVCGLMIICGTGCEKSKSV